MPTPLKQYTFTDPTGVAKYKDNEGVFFLVVDDQIRCQQTCRESVEYRFQEFMAQKGDRMIGKKMLLAFKSEKITAEKLNAFWKPIFKKLGRESVVLFHTCNVENTIVVNMRKFWMQNQATRGVFTMLLRASGIYQSYEDACKNYYILAHTLKAFQHFLEGNTQPTFEFATPKHGWYHYFRIDNNPDLAKWLVKPKPVE